MIDEKLDRSGPLYAAIGETFLGQLGEDCDLFIYAEAGDGWTETAPFIIRTDSIEWFDPGRAGNEAIERAREVEDPGRRWAAMEYEVKDGSFTVRLRYPEELDPRQFTSDRREEILHRRFGNRVIRYPKLF